MTVEKIMEKVREYRWIDYGDERQIDVHDEIESALAALVAENARLREAKQADEATVAEVIRSLWPGTASVILHDGAGRRIGNEPTWAFAKRLSAALAFCAGVDEIRAALAEPGERS